MPISAVQFTVLFVSKADSSFDEPAFLFTGKEVPMRKMFEIKCKIPVAFYVEAETADEAITTIRSTLSGKRIPNHTNVIQGTAIRSLDNNIACEFDADKKGKSNETIYS